MNIKYFSSIVLLASVLLFSACTKNNVAVDKGPINGRYAQFYLPTGGTYASTTKNYKITAAQLPFPILVELTDSSAKDTKIQFTYTSRNSAAQGMQFNAPIEMTIKSGVTLDTLKLKGIYLGYAGGRVDTVKIKMSSTDVPTGVNDSMMVIMKR